MSDVVPAAPAFLIHQTHDASGAPAPAEYRREFPSGLVSMLTMQPVYHFLAPLNVLPTGQPGFFSYSDPAVGRGTMHAVGFDQYAGRGIENYVLTREIDAAIGISEPTRWDGRQSGLGSPRPFKNPWISTAGAVAIILASLGFAAYALLLELLDPVRADAVLVVSLVFAFIFIGLGTVLLIQHVPRIRWWMRARAYLRSTGRAIPDDLQRFN